MMLTNAPILIGLCAFVVILAAAVTLRWSIRHGLLRFVAICLGIVLLLMATSRDQHVAESTKADVESYQAQVKAAETAESEMASKIAALQEANKDLETTVAQSSREKQEAADEAKRLREALLDAAKTVADVVPNTANKTTTLRIKEAVLFDVNKADLSCDSKEKLSRVIGFLTYQVRIPHTQLHVIGHTDDTGSDAHDDALSKNRAAGVQKYFISSGIPADIVTAEGMGKRQPAGFTDPQSADVIRKENVTAEQRQKNRRVDIVVSTQ